MRPADKKLLRYTLYFLMALMAGIFRGIDNPDEMWNYNFASCIANGLLPYRDFNLLQTPLSCLINAIAIFVLGHHLLVIRMMGVILFTLIAIESDKIGVVLGKKPSIIMLLPSVFLCCFFWNVFLEYSCFIVFCAYFAIRNDLEVLNGRSMYVKAQLAVGILLGCAMMCKQTTGTFIAACGWICCIVTLWLSGEKKKEIIKGLFFRMLGSSIPCLIFLLYLLGTGTFKDFWDMCYLGIFTFSSKYSYLEYMKENLAYLLAGILLIVLMIGGAVAAIVCRKNDRGKRAILLLIYAGFSWINIVPLANSYHVCLTAMTVVFLAFVILPDKFVDTIVFRTLSGIAVFGMALFMMVINPVMAMNKNVFVDDINGLEYVLAPKEDIKAVKEIIGYVDEMNSKGINVYILDNYAPLYFMPSNQYHKYLDMFLNGNLGTATPKEILEKTKKGSIFLMPDSERKNFQMPMETMKEYMSSLTLLGRICDFTIYQK